jgi:hypothetical protein
LTACVTGIVSCDARQLITSLYFSFPSDGFCVFHFHILQLIIKLFLTINKAGAVNIFLLLADTHHIIQTHYKIKIQNSFVTARWN